MEVNRSPSFGKWLKQRRKTLDLTQDELAARVGCAAVTIYKIEANERRPSKQIAALLAKQLDIPPDDHSEFVRFARAEIEGVAAPWGTSFHPPTNLPVPPTVLIGRDNEITDLRKRLLQPDMRLITLTGPPGIGKTRLALEIASQLLDEFADGVFMIALASVNDANLVASTIGTILGMIEAGVRNPLERLKVFLHEKQMLLLLDNFEQILAAAPQIADLLAACPWLKILVTSRAPLRIRSERQIPVAPLAVPDSDHPAELEAMKRYSAVSLFIERAQSIKPDFSLTQDNAPVIAALCARLDGLPLAIELISARVKLLPPSALLERLHGRLMLQSDGLRDIEPRQRTLNGAITWSYQLLSADEQALFRRLGVFVGGWTLEAAEAICTENLQFNIVDGIASLLDKSLLRQDTRSNEKPAYTMLETLREYALEKLIENHENESIRRAHAQYFLTRVGNSGKLIGTAEEQHAFQEFETNYTNIRVAWMFAIEMKDEHLLGLAAERLAAFYVSWGRIGEGFEGYQAALFSLDDPDSLTAANLMIGYARLALYHNDTFEMCETYTRRALAIYERIGRQDRKAHGLFSLANIFAERNEIGEAEQLWLEAMALAQEADDTPLIDRLTMNLITADLIDERARQRLESLRTSLKQRGIRSQLCWVLSNLLEIAFDAEDLPNAKVLALELLENAKVIHGVRFFRTSYAALAFLAFIEQDYASAKRCTELWLDAARNTTIENFIVDAECMMSVVASVTEAKQTAERFFQSILRRAHNRVFTGLEVLTADAYIQFNTGKLDQALEDIAIVLNHPDCNLRLPLHYLLKPLQVKLEAQLSPQEYQSTWERGKMLDLNRALNLRESRQSTL